MLTSVLDAVVDVGDSGLAVEDPGALQFDLLGSGSRRDGFLGRTAPGDMELERTARIG
jgi:hypothetical protein